MDALASVPSSLGIPSGIWFIVGFAFVFTRAMIARIKTEEAMLSSHFGKEWDEYMSKRWRLIPFMDYISATEWIDPCP